MSVIRVGSTTTYAQNWDAIFGGKKAAKKAAKKAVKKKAKKKRA
jgi:hypothetical protein